VLCITHLPQVAVQGERHFLVSKTSARGRTETKVATLGARERVDEIARMAGGEEVTDATRRHARALLESARERAAARPAPAKPVRQRTPPPPPRGPS
jgi:DNA repair protein RecN (Recombination protein N)